MKQTFTKSLLALAASSALLLSSCKHCPFACETEERAPASAGLTHMPTPEEMETIMARQMELAQLAPEHAQLAKLAGRWERETEFRMGVDQPWQKSQGTSECKLAVGGRYVIESLSGDMMGAPFEGMQILGYDTMAGEYTSIWFDNWSTWAISSRGTRQADGAIHYRGTMVDAVGERPFRFVMKWQGDDAFECEMYDTIPPAGETLVMKLRGKRAASAS